MEHIKEWEPEIQEELTIQVASMEEITAEMEKLRVSYRNKDKSCPYVCTSILLLSIMLSFIESVSKIRS